jgi:hypothetical protein
MVLAERPRMIMIVGITRPFDMINEKRTEYGRSGKWWVAMFRDVQFWVPVAVLLAGLIVLRAIQ